MGRAAIVRVVTTSAGTAVQPAPRAEGARAAPPERSPGPSPVADNAWLPWQRWRTPPPQTPAYQPVRGLVGNPPRGQRAFDEPARRPRRSRAVSGVDRPHGRPGAGL